MMPLQLHGEKERPLGSFTHGYYKGLGGFEPAEDGSLDGPQNKPPKYGGEVDKEIPSDRRDSQNFEGGRH